MDDGKEAEEEVKASEWCTVILIRERDCRVLLIICKTPHKMNRSNQSPANDKKALLEVSTIKDIMQRTGIES